LVTHDTYGTFKLETRVMVMNEGKQLQFDTPQAIVHHPVAPYVEALVDSRTIHVRRLQ
jgi:ABC-type proline/glycine betaine transport system ATPase subunit